MLTNRQWQILRECARDDASFDKMLQILGEVMQPLRRRDDVLLAAANAVMIEQDFETSARAIFDFAKEITGAASGYVALLSDDGAENEVLFLDAGGLPCDVNPELPMPIRGLREQAYRLKKAVYHNDFHHSDWMRFMPAGHVRLDNVMFAPLVIGDQAVGLMGLANKPDPFSDEDARLATVFGQLAAIALHNSRVLDKLRDSRARARALLNAPSDWIMLVDCEGHILETNATFATYLGFAIEDLIGKDIFDLFPPGISAWRRRQLENACAKGEIMHYEEERADRYFDVVVYPILDTDETVSRVAVVIRDITDIKKAAEHEVQLAVEQQKVEVLRQFIADASHDLKTPLAAMDMALSLLRMLPEGAERERQFSSMQRQISTLTKAVQNMLCMAKLDMESDYQFEPIPLNPLLQQLVDDVRPGVTQKGIHLVMVPCLTHPVIEADPDYLSRAIQNLLDNAIKFTPAGGQVTVRSTQEDGHIRIKVTDTGVGIDPDDLPHIFERFYRADKARSAPEGGSGLGLAIARKAIDMHGGRIEVESQPGQGSTFSIWLPT